MAEDLSRLAADSIWVTSQAAPGSRHSADLAMSSPGSIPAMSDGPDQPAPRVTVTDYDAKGILHVLNDEGGKQIPDTNPARPSPFTRADGTGVWKSTRVDLPALGPVSATLGRIPPAAPGKPSWTEPGHPPA